MDTELQTIQAPQRAICPLTLVHCQERLKWKGYRANIAKYEMKTQFLLKIITKVYHLKKRSGGRYIVTYTWDIKSVEMAWNMVLNHSSVVSISGQDTTDISLDFLHYAVSLVSCQEFLPTE
jgi:hypothetical protein